MKEPILNRTRRLLGMLVEPNGYMPDGVAATIVKEAAKPRLFVVSKAIDQMVSATEAPDFDPTNIEANIANAAKDNTTMNERPVTQVEALRNATTKYRTELEIERDRIKSEQKAANDEHKEQIERLTEEMKSRNEAHSDATKDFDARIADAEAAIEALDATLYKLSPVAPPAPTPAPAA